MDSDYEVFKLELEYMEVNPLTFYVKLVVGVIFAILSLCWWL